MRYGIGVRGYAGAQGPQWEDKTHMHSAAAGRHSKTQRKTETGMAGWGGWAGHKVAANKDMSATPLLWCAWRVVVRGVLTPPPPPPRAWTV